MEENIKNSLQIIFNEINKMKDITYSQIKNKHLDNMSDIWEAIANTGFNKYLDSFEVQGRQYDVGKIIEGIQNYISYEIEYMVEQDQWQ